ncbi:MAG: hypothetical protein IPF87_08875 [Gemmatimonadetes bacterium]|nr:hypothetical protein [Gemmatimonadota bacterium]
MAHVAITSDRRGTIFAIDHAGRLFRNRHQSGSRRVPLLHSGVGLAVGTGWAGVRQVAAIAVGERVLLAGIDRRQALVLASAPSGGDGEWDAVAAPTVTPLADPADPAGVSTPQLQSVFAGGGALYMITRDGALLRQRFTAGAPSSASPGAPTALPDIVAGPVDRIASGGWGDAMLVFADDEGTCFEITTDGTLRYQVVAGPGGAPSSGGWQVLARGWARYQHAMAAGDRHLYAIGSEGGVEVHRYDRGTDGTLQLSASGRGTVVGEAHILWGGNASDVEGYCWPLSQVPGGTIDVKVGVRLSNPPDGVPMDPDEPVSFTVDVRRLRRMKGGVEGVYDEVKLPALGTYRAPRYALNADYLEHGAGWATTFSLTIPDLPPGDPAHWESGLYAVRCTDTKGRDYYVSFVVRPREARRAFAVLANTNTWNAYNMWGGYGKYSHTYPVPETLPFFRPNPALTPDVAQATSRGKNVGLPVLTNSCHLLRAELWVLGWLEDQGAPYAVDVYSDQDMHDGIPGLGVDGAPPYRALILNTHPEYWTRAMYDHAIAYLARGGSILYLGGNGVYEEVVFSDDRQHMAIFPGVDRSKLPSTLTNEQIRLYSLMRTPYVGRPEHALFGVGFLNCAQSGAQGQPYILEQDPAAPDANPVLAGVTLKQGAAMGAASVDTGTPGSNGVAQTFCADGWEIDVRGFGTPWQAYAASARIAYGTGDDPSGEMLCYRTDQGGVVFAAASLNFGGAMVLDANLARIVRNALDLCPAC